MSKLKTTTSHKRKVEVVEDISDIEESSPPLPLSQLRRHPVKGRERLADLRADLIDFKARRLRRQGRMPMQPRQAEESAEPEVSAAHSPPLSSLSSSSSTTHSAGEADPLPESPPEPVDCVYSVQYRNKRKDKERWKAGYLSCRCSLQLTTVELLSASHQPLQQAVFPVARLRMPISSTSSIDCDPFLVEVVSDVAPPDVAALQREKAGLRSRRTEQRSQLDSRTGRKVDSRDLTRGFQPALRVRESEGQQP